MHEINAKFQRAIEDLLKKIDSETNREDAMKLSQAALNLAHAAVVWKGTK